MLQKINWKDLVQTSVDYHGGRKGKTNKQIFRKKFSSFLNIPWNWQTTVKRQTISKPPVVAICFYFSATVKNK
jgi:hypothetical protein